MSVSRRGILGGFFAAPVVAALPVAAAPSTPVVQTPTPTLPLDNDNSIPASLITFLSNSPQASFMMRSFDEVTQRIRQAADDSILALHYDTRLTALCQTREGIAHVLLQLDEQYEIPIQFNELWISLGGMHWCGFASDPQFKRHTHTNADGVVMPGNRLHYRMTLTPWNFERISGKPLA